MYNPFHNIIKYVDQKENELKLDQMPTGKVLEILVKNEINNQISKITGQKNHQQN